MARTKKYEDGGLTFADMPEEDRASQARAAMDAINARQAAASEAAGGESATKTTPSRSKAPVVSRKYRDEGSQGIAKMAGKEAVVGKDRGAFGRLVDTFRSGPKLLKSGGKVGSASKRADGCAQRGKTKGKVI